MGGEGGGGDGGGGDGGGGDGGGGEGGGGDGGGGLGGGGDGGGGDGDGWGPKADPSTVHQEEQDDMPRWGGQGQHEGGWCKVREGREEGRKGGIAGFELSIPGFPPPCQNRQADYDCFLVQRRERSAKTSEPTRPPAVFVVCV